MDPASKMMTLDSLPNPSSYVDLGKVIGEGAYGKVFKAKLRSSKEVVAVKVMPVPADEEAEVAQECEVMAKYSNHQNIASFCAVYTHFAGQPGGVEISATVGKHVWLVMEFCAYGSAFDMVEYVRKPPNAPGT